MMPLKIRDEAAADAEHIRTVTQTAFGGAAHASGTEADIVEALREAGALSVSLVAMRDERLIGHVAVSPVRIVLANSEEPDAPGEWFGLGPISVLPAEQGNGVGTQLMNRALARLEAQGARGCVLVGDPGYYSRFGFHAVEGLGYANVPAEYVQALSFGGVVPRGSIRYHEAFELDAG